MKSTPNPFLLENIRQPVRLRVRHRWRPLWRRHAGLLVAACGAGLLGFWVGPSTGGAWPSLLSAWGLFFLPFLLAASAIDLLRWRMRVHQNRERQRVFQHLNDEMINAKTRLLQELLTLRRKLLEQGQFDSPVTRYLDTLIVDQHRHLSGLHQRACDSDLMAPLLTAAYAHDIGESTWTWTASLQGEFDGLEGRRNDR